MFSEHDTAQCLRDIIENADRIAGYVAGMDLATLKSDLRTRDAAERCLERICEAAHRLGYRAPALMPNHPWSDIRGTGNWLRHGYDRIDFATLYNILLAELPSLGADAREALDRLQSQPPQEG